MGNNITVHTNRGAVVIARNGLAALAMTYAEANRLQAEIRQHLVNEGVTLSNALLA